MIVADQRWLGKPGIAGLARHVLADLDYRFPQAVRIPLAIAVSGQVVSQDVRNSSVERQST